MRPLKILLLASIPATLWSQAVVEYGLGAAAAGTAGAAAGRSASGIAGAFANLTKALGGGDSPRAAAASNTPKAATTAAPKPAAPAKPAVVYEDAAGIKPGMERSELLSRFGEPAMKITAGADAESLVYAAKDGTVEVEMRGGKVESVHAKPKARQAAVVVLQ